MIAIIGDVPTPWWITIVATLVGGALTLVAALLTTITTNRYAARRLETELLHQRYLEREKALYESRIATYTEIIRYTFELDDLIRELKSVDATEGSNSEAANRDSIIQAMSIFQKFEVLIPVISSNQVVDSFIELSKECARLTETLRAQDHQGRTKVENWDTLSAETGRLIVAIRREIGSDLDENIHRSVQ